MAIIQNDVGAYTTPSMVGFKGDDRKVGIAADDKEAFFRKLVIVNQDRSVDRYSFHILRNTTVLIVPYLNRSSMMQPSRQRSGFEQS